jgi:hypothetical protein
MKERRNFKLPKAWVFTKDKDNYYLEFSESLAKKLYSQGKRGW